MAERTQVGPRPATGMRQAGPCNACGGKGSVRPFVTRYPFSEDNVRKFVAFLKASGGFRIL